MHVLYGITNCDTVKKARTWLDKHAIEYRFHDFRKHGLEPDMLLSFVKAVGWQILLNRSGMTWRKLPEYEKADLDEQRAIALMLDHCTIIKRPVLVLHKAAKEKFHVGFQETTYESIFLHKE